LRVSADGEGPGSLPRRRLADALGRPLDGRARWSTGRADPPQLRKDHDARPRLPRVRRAGRRARHARASGARAHEAASRREGGTRMSAIAVDRSVSRTPIPRDATDLPTVCVLCSHNCGVRVDVADGVITAVRADERNPITTGYICNKAVSIPNYVRH